MITREEFYKRLGQPFLSYNLKRRRQDALWDKKWHKFLKKSYVFKYFPFVDFVFVAGSMALGNVRPESDVDILVGIKENRIFTVRFLMILVFGALGWRRKKLIHAAEEAKDKICLNHFVTPSSCRLSPPYDLYWQELYQNLVPIFGKEKDIDKFFETNDWMKPSRNYFDDLRNAENGSIIKKLLEKILKGGIGNALEKVLRFIQIRKIEKSIKKQPPGFEPRLKYKSNELEFHLDTSRIASLLKE